MPGNVEQDRGARAAVDRADIGADQDQQRLVRRHLDRQRRHQRDAHRRGEAGQRADDDADERRQQDEPDRQRIEKRRQRMAERDQAVEHQGSRTKNNCSNTSVTMTRRARRRTRSPESRRRASIRVASPVMRSARRNTKTKAVTKSRSAEPERQSAADQQQRVDEEHRGREREARRRGPASRRRSRRHPSRPRARGAPSATPRTPPSTAIRSPMTPGHNPGAVYSSAPCCSSRSIRHEPNTMTRAERDPAAQRACAGRCAARPTADVMCARLRHRSLAVARSATAARCRACRARPWPCRRRTPATRWPAPPA